MGTTISDWRGTEPDDDDDDPRSTEPVASAWDDAELERELALELADEDLDLLGPADGRWDDDEA